MLFPSSQRLRFRSVSVDDVPAMWRALHSPGLTAGLRMEPPSSKAALVRTIEQSEKDRYAFTITETNNDELIGQAFIIKREDWEIGIWLAPEHQGKGYATEAVRALIDYAQTQLSIPVIYATVMPWNTASKRMLLRAGLHPTGKTRWMMKGKTKVLVEEYATISGAVA